jgi:hypothetical protein
VQDRHGDARNAFDDVGMGFYGRSIIASLLEESGYAMW